MVWFGLVYLFIHSVTHVTLDTSITDYNLYITTQLIPTSTQYNIINNNTKFKGPLEVEFVTTSRYICVYLYKYTLDHPSLRHLDNNRL
jgi:hypothetical protein